MAPLMSRPSVGRKPVGQVQRVQQQVPVSQVPTGQQPVQQQPVWQQQGQQGAVYQQQPMQQPVYQQGQQQQPIQRPVYQQQPIQQPVFHQGQLQQPMFQQPVQQQQVNQQPAYQQQGQQQPVQQRQVQQQPIYQQQVPQQQIRQQPVQQYQQTTQQQPVQQQPVQQYQQPVQQQPVQQLQQPIQQRPVQQQPVQQFQQPIQQQQQPPQQQPNQPQSFQQLQQPLQQRPIQQQPGQQQPVQQYQQQIQQQPVQQRPAQHQPLQQQPTQQQPIAQRIPAPSNTTTQAVNRRSISSAASVRSVGSVTSSHTNPSQTLGSPTSFPASISQHAPPSFITCSLCTTDISNDSTHLECLACTSAQIPTLFCTQCCVSKGAVINHKHHMSNFVSVSDVVIFDPEVSVHGWDVRKSAIGIAWYYHKGSKIKTFEKPKPPIPVAQPQNFPAASNVPDGWEEIKDPDGRLFYYHRATKVSKWTRPQGNQLPTGWIECTNPDGRTYYLNTITQATTWDRPVGSSAPANDDQKSISSAKGAFLETSERSPTDKRQSISSQGQSAATPQSPTSIRSSTILETAEWPTTGIEKSTVPAHRAASVPNTFVQTTNWSPSDPTHRPIPMRSETQPQQGEWQYDQYGHRQQSHTFSKDALASGSAVATKAVVKSTKTAASATAKGMKVAAKKLKNSKNAQKIVAGVGMAAVNAVLMDQFGVKLPTSVGTAAVGLVNAIDFDETTTVVDVTDMDVPVDNDVGGYLEDSGDLNQASIPDVNQMNTMPGNDYVVGGDTEVVETTTIVQEEIIIVPGGPAPMVHQPQQMRPGGTYGGPQHVNTGGPRNAGPGPIPGSAEWEFNNMQRPAAMIGSQGVQVHKPSQQQGLQSRRPNQPKLNQQQNPTRPNPGRPQGAQNQNFSKQLGHPVNSNPKKPLLKPQQKAALMNAGMKIGTSLLRSAIRSSMSGNSGGDNYDYDDNDNSFDFGDNSNLDMGDSDFPDDGGNGFDSNDNFDNVAADYDTQDQNQDQFVDTDQQFDNSFNGDTYDTGNANDTNDNGGNDQYPDCGNSPDNADVGNAYNDNSADQQGTDPTGYDTTFSAQAGFIIPPDTTYDQQSDVNQQSQGIFQASMADDNAMMNGVFTTPDVNYNDQSYNDQSYNDQPDINLQAQGILQASMGDDNTAMNGFFSDPDTTLPQDTISDPNAGVNTDTIAADNLWTVDVPDPSNSQTNVASPAYAGLTSASLSGPMGDYYDSFGDLGGEIPLGPDQDDDQNATTPVDISSGFQSDGFFPDPTLTSADQEVSSSSNQDANAFTLPDISLDPQPQSQDQYQDPTQDLTQDPTQDPTQDVTTQPTDAGSTTPNPNPSTAAISQLYDGSAYGDPDSAVNSPVDAQSMTPSSIYMAGSKIAPFATVTPVTPPMMPVTPPIMSVTPPMMPTPDAIPDPALLVVGP